MVHTKLSKCELATPFHIHRILGYSVLLHLVTNTNPISANPPVPPTSTHTPTHSPPPTQNTGLVPGGMGNYTGPDGCPRCRRRVYMAEKIVGAGAVSSPYQLI